MLKTILAGASMTVLAATLAYAQNAPQGTAPAAGAGRGPAPAANGAPAPRPQIQELPTEEQWKNMPASAKAYVDKAAQLAGNDADLKFDMSIFCQADAGATGRARANLKAPEGAPYPAWGAPNPAVKVPAQHLFDNFWWFGDTGVGAWLITSNDGYILFDASNNAADAKSKIVDEMVRVGLDPKKIKYIVFGHWHGDHTGGGHYIQQLSGAKAIMGRDDWKLYLDMYDTKNPAMAQRLSRLDDKTPLRRDADSDAVDGQKITVGDVTATIFQMTGHTPGSIGMVTPIKWKGQTHNILLITAGSDISSREAFIGGYEHIFDEGIKMKVESVMQVHPNTNMNTLARVKYVNDNFDRLTATNNPLLYGPAKTEKYLNIVRACVQARMDILGW
jgi:metallo-beta-lactamase class B